MYARYILQFYRIIFCRRKNTLISICTTVANLKNCIEQKKKTSEILICGNILNETQRF